MSDEEIHEGGCQCGAVRFRTHGKPQKTALCHCRYCQTRTGSAFGISTYFASEKVTFLSGELKDYEFGNESGRTMRTRFCTRCGTTVSWSLSLMDGMTGIAGGLYDPPTFWYELTREVFTRSRAPFLCAFLPEQSETTSSYAPKVPEQSWLDGG